MGSRGQTTVPTRYNDATRYAVVTIVSPERRRSPPSTMQCCFFKECDVTTGVSNAAPHSCRRSDDNTLKWQTLGQTCSRGDPGGAICVQRLDDSLNSAIHTRYRSLLRSSSMHEPRDPPSEVVKFSTNAPHQNTTQGLIKVKQKTKDGRSPLEARRAEGNNG